MAGGGYLIVIRVCSGLGGWDGQPCFGPCFLTERLSDLRKHLPCSGRVLGLQGCSGVMVWEPRERVAVLKVGESWCVRLESVLPS